MPGNGKPTACCSWRVARSTPVANYAANRAAARALTRSERLIASLTAAAVRVYEEICTLARLNCGRVFPTYDYLARATALAVPPLRERCTCSKRPPSSFASVGSSVSKGRAALQTDIERLLPDASGAGAALSTPLAAPGGAARRPGSA